MEATYLHITAAAFRMGSHSLNIEARRWGKGKRFTSRPFRRCTCCDLGIVEDVEDEMHVVFECPVYGEACKKFTDNELDCWRGSVNRI
jgi:hypothetical protein